MNIGNLNKEIIPRRCEQTEQRAQSLQGDCEYDLPFIPIGRRYGY